MLKFLPRTTAQLAIRTRKQARFVQRSFNIFGLVASGSDQQRLDGWSVDVSPVAKVKARRVSMAVRGGLIQV